MEKKILFPQIGGFVHGGDYNPEQWLDRPDILEQDVELMKKAGINSASVGILSTAFFPGLCWSPRRESTILTGWRRS